MLKPEELVAGKLIWWHADRHFREWSVPGIIKEIRPASNEYVVQTFDDFNVSVLDSQNTDTLKEMREATKKEVVRFLQDAKRRREDRIIEAKRKLEDAEGALQDWSKQAEEINGLLG